MRLIDLARPHLDGVRTVAEVSAPDLDLRPFLSELQDVGYQTVSPDAWERGEAPEIAAGTLVVMALGPDRSRHLPFRVGARILGHVGPQGRGLMLFGYPSGELPYHRVIDALTTHGCQVLHAASLDYSCLRCGIAFARAGRLQPPRDFSGRPVTGSPAGPAGPAAGPGTGGAIGEDRVTLRIANEYVLSGFVSRGLRARLLDLERTAGAAADERSEAAGLTARNERLARDLENARRRLSRAEARIAAIEGSATWEVGRLLVGAARNPRRGARVPRQLYRMWQQRGRSGHAAAGASAAPAGDTGPSVTAGLAAGYGREAPRPRPEQPAQLAGPATPGWEPAWGAADALLAAFTAPGAVRAACAGQLVIAGILTARSAATLEPDAVVHPLLPHDAALVLERTAADLVLIEASALLADGPWAYAADPAAADRGRLLGGLIRLAHGLGKPVVLLRDVPPSRLPELGRLASRCDAVTDAGLGVQLARFNPIDLAPDRSCDPVYCGTRSPRERPAQRRLLDELTGEGGPVRLIAAGSWLGEPSLYRRHGLFVASSAAQAREQLACGARVIGPPGAGDAPARIREEIEAARGRGPCGLTEIRETLRGLFNQHATPARIAGLARLAGLPATPGGSRQIAVLAMPRDRGEVTRLASGVLRQRHRPIEVVLTLPAEAALTERMVSAAFAEVTASGITVRTVRAGEPGEAEPGGAPQAVRAARAVRAPWAAPWDVTREYPDTHLLDLACARECSRADAVGYSPGDGYVFSAKIEPALARPGLLAGSAAEFVTGGSTRGAAGGAAFSSAGWARRGLALLAVPGT